jgi:hypothetical protein
MFPHEVIFFMSKNICPSTRKILEDMRFKQHHVNRCLVVEKPENPPPHAFKEN